MKKFFSKIFKIFLNQEFFMFVLIGLINTFDVIWMSLVYSLIMGASISFAFGWTTSLIVAYTLNSLLNFKEKLSLKNLFKFFLSNVPNFIIQIVTAFIFLDILNFDKIISYFVSAIIGVPVTFICIKIFIFNKKNKLEL